MEPRRETRLEKWRKNGCLCGRRGRRKDVVNRHLWHSVCKQHRQQSKGECKVWSYLAQDCSRFTIEICNCGRKLVWQGRVDQDVQNNKWIVRPKSDTVSRFWWRMFFILLHFTLSLENVVVCHSAHAAREKQKDSLNTVESAGSCDSNGWEA